MANSYNSESCTSNASTSSSRSSGPMPIFPVQIGFNTGLYTSPLPSTQQGPDVFASAFNARGTSYISDEELLGNFDDLADALPSVCERSTSEPDSHQATTPASVDLPAVPPSTPIHHKPTRIRVVSSRRKRDRKPARRVSKPIDAMASIPEKGSI